MSLHLLFILAIETWLCQVVSELATKQGTNPNIRASIRVHGKNGEVYRYRAKGNIQQDE